MDVTKSVDIADLFSAKDLVVAITGGGTGTYNAAKQIALEI